MERRIEIGDHRPGGMEETPEENEISLQSACVTDSETEEIGVVEKLLESALILELKPSQSEDEKVIIPISVAGTKIEETEIAVSIVSKIEDNILLEIEGTKKEEEDFLLASSVIQTRTEEKVDVENVLESTLDMSIGNLKSDEANFIIPTCIARTDVEENDIALERRIEIGDHRPGGMEETPEENEISLKSACVIDSQTEEIGVVEKLLESALILEIKPSQSEDEKVIIPISVTGTKIEETEIAVSIVSKIEDNILLEIEGTKKGEEDILLASSVIQTRTEEKVDVENVLESTLDMSIGNLKSDEANFIIPTCIARTDVEENDIALERTIEIGDHRPGGMEETPEEDEISLKRACVIDSKTEEIGVVEKLLESALILEIKPSQSEDEKVMIPISVTATKIEETEIAVSIVSKIEDNILLEIEGTKKEEEDFLLASSVIQTRTEEKVDVENVLESTLDMSIGNLKSDEANFIIPTCIARTDVEENDIAFERRIEIGDHRPGGMEETPEENEISLKSACVIDSQTDEIGVVEKLLESALILEIKPSQSEDEKVIIPISVTATKIEETEIAVSIVSKIEDNILLEIEGTKKEEEDILLASSVIQTRTEEKVDVENVLESTLDMSIGNLKSDEANFIIPTCIARTDVEENDIALERRIEIGDHRPGGMEETPEEDEISLKRACVIDSKTEEIGVVEKLLESALILEIKPSQSEDEKVIIPISVTATKIEETEIAVSIVSKIEDNILLEIEGTKKEEEDFLLASSVIQTRTEEKVDVENVLESTLDMSIGNLKSDEANFIIPTCIARTDVEENDIALERRIEIGDHRPGGMEETPEENEISLKSACVIDSQTEEIGVVEKLLESALILEIKPSQSEDEKVIIPISVTGTKIEETEIAVSIVSKIEDNILLEIEGTKKEEEDFLLASSVIQTRTEEKVDVENVLESTLDMSIGNLKSDEANFIIPTCIARTDVEENDIALERRIEIGDHRPGGMEETPEEDEISLKRACVIDSKTEEIGVVEKLLESALILEIKPSQSEDEKVIIPISVTATKIEETEIAVSIVSKIEDNILLEIEGTKKEEEEFLLASSVIQTRTEEKVVVENVLESTLDMSIGNLKSDEANFIIPTCIARTDVEENDIALERRIEIGDHRPGGMEETPEEDEISLKRACVIDSKTEEIGVVEKLLESALILEIKPSQSEDEKVIIPISVTATKIEETEIAVSIVSKIEDNILLEIEGTKKEEEEFLLASSVIQTRTEEKVVVENVLESTLDMSIGNLKSDEANFIIPTCIARIDVEENAIALERRIEIGDHRPGGMEETPEEDEISLKRACVIDSKTEEIGVVEKLLESAPYFGD